MSEEQKPLKLVCIKDAVMPGLGSFKSGDVITDSDLIDRIGIDHPFFQKDVEEAPKEEGQ